VCGRVRRQVEQMSVFVEESLVCHGGECSIKFIGT
jgi:hypothetical protein